MKTADTRYDLTTRNLEFAARVHNFCKELNKDRYMIGYCIQITKAASSIGANYEEANGASSKRDFRAKIAISKKEAQEVRYWLKLLEAVAGSSTGLHLC